MEQETERQQVEKAEDLEMTGQDTDVGDTFFDSEEDDAPVDMDVVFEAMKHVPLPDFDYAERDDTIPAAVTESLPAEATGSEPPKPATSKAIIKGSSGTGEAGPVKKKGAGRGRALKRVKVADNATDIKEKSSSKMPGKGDGSAFAAAAKVAAEVAPDVVTGGVVAEAGPRPDFSLWTVEDDLLLKNAMEAGAAVEALAKGAMRFSHRFTVRELRERWRALLYDPEISAEAAARMVETEAALSSLPPKPRGPHDRHAKLLERKRRLNSIRTLYYKRRRLMAEEKLVSATESQTLEDGVDRDGETHEEEGGKSVIVPLDMTALGNVDPGLLEGLLSPKEGTTDFEDRTFSQMVSLLAAGGVGAVIGALPGGSNIDNVEEDHKAGQESQIGFGFTETNSKDAQESGIFVSRPNESVIQCDLQPPNVAGTNEGFADEGLNVSIDLCPEKGKENLDASTTQSLKKQPVEGECVPQLPADKDVLKKAGTEEAGHVADGGCKQQTIGGLSVSQCPRQASTGSPVLGGLLDTPSEHMVKNSDHPGTAQAEGEEEAPLVRAEGSSCKMTPTTNLCIVKTESQGSDLGAVKNDKLDVCAQILDVGRASRIEALRVEVPECHDVPEKNNWLVTELRDGEEGDEEYDSLHVHWKYGELGADRDLEGEEHGSFIDYEGDNEGDNEGKQFEEEHEEFEEGAGDDPGYESDSHEALLDLDPGDPASTEEISEVMMDLVLGPLVCTLSRQETEIPNLDDALLLPIVESPLDYGSEGDVREDDLLDCTSPDDEADLPGSPSEFHLYEELESPDMLGAQLNGPRYEGDNGWNQAAAAGSQGNLAGRALFQSSGSHPLAGNPSPGGVYGSRLIGEGGGAPLSDIDSDHQLAQGSGFHEFSSHAGQPRRAPPNASGNISSIPQHTREMVSVDGEGDGYWTEFDPQTGQEVLVRLDPDTGEPRSEGEASPPEIEEEEPESEAEMARFSDVETMIMNMDLDPGVDDEFSALEESRRMYRQQRRVLVRLEQNISAAMQRSLTKRKALAILYGRHLRYYMTKTEVSMGRMTQDNIVDIDLGKEGRANKVSRQQAFLKLKEDGVFYLRNLGRRSLTVNNIAIDTDQRAILGSNCLIEVGGMRFIFEINKRLVKHQIERMHRAS